MIVQGLGNVGYHAALFLAEEEGAVITHVLERGGAVVNPQGIAIDALKQHLDKKGSVEGFPGFQKSGPEMLEAEADILIPAALEMVITQENAHRIKTPLIIEAANGPVSAEADAILRDKGVVIIPDLYANAGGVTVSYFEWIKNLSHIRFGRLQKRQSQAQFEAMISGMEDMTGIAFPEKQKAKAMHEMSELALVRSGLEDTMRKAYEDISAEWNSNPKVVDLRNASMLTALSRIVKSYGSLGL